MKRYVSSQFWTLSQATSFKEARLQDILFFAGSESVRSALGAQDSGHGTSSVKSESDAELRLYQALVGWLVYKEERKENLVKVMNCVKFHVIQVSFFYYSDI